MTHPLPELLEAAARGSFPPADGSVEVMPPPPGPAMAILGFSGHYVLASTADEEWVRSNLPEGDLGAAMSPAFLVALGRELGRRQDSLDVVLAAPGLPGETSLREATGDSHPRVERARAHREDVRVLWDLSGAAVVVLGRGLALRTELAIEVDEEARGRGLARAVLTEARRAVHPDELLFAQTAPGNAASLRTLLAAGFRPIGSEVLFFA